jgi:hypothetical protein
MPLSQLLRRRVAALVAIVGTACSATSRMPQAKISESNGLPCFAIADDAETRAGVRLYSLVVSERESEDSQSLPAELWRFIVAPPGDWIDTTPQRCIRYGEPPPSAKPQSVAKPLVPGRVYVAFLGARPNAATVPVVGYRAEFCLMRGSDGKSGVLVVPWDQGAKRWRYEVCTAR